MPPVAEYDIFDYKTFDEPGLSLDEATQKAERLRRSDSGHAYRVLPLDPSLTGFYVAKLPIQQAYADVWTRLLRHLLRIYSSAASSAVPPAALKH